MELFILVKVEAVMFMEYYTDELYQIALPATHLRRYVEFVTSVQVLDLTHVCDAIIPAQRRVT
jgi:hypothetical protein